MNRELVDLLAGAGLADIVMPRKKFMAEHKYLIGLLRKYDRFPDLKKEADEQEAEMKSYTGGFSKQSGFIRRMMAENALKHSGQYRKPTDPLAPGSTMNKPVAFDYKSLANPEQKGNNRTGNPYGASPFIQKHFGTAEVVPFVRKRGEPLPTAPFPNKKRGRKTAVAPVGSAPPVDTEEAAKEEVDEPIRPFGYAEDGKVRPPSPPRKTEVREAKPGVKENVAREYKSLIDVYKRFEKTPMKGYVPQVDIEKAGKRGGFFLTVEDRETDPSKYKTIVAKPNFIISPGIDVNTIKRVEDRDYSDYSRGQNVNIKYYVPPGECVLTRYNEPAGVEIDTVELFNIGQTRAGKYTFSFGGTSEVGTPRIRLTTKQPLPKEFWRQGAGTIKNELMLVEKRAGFLSDQYFAGWKASRIVEGDRKLYAEKDRKAGIKLPSRAEELDQDLVDEFLPEIKKVAMGGEEEGGWVLTINEIGVWVWQGK
jgi:hypothetical protein